MPLSPMNKSRLGYNGRDLIQALKVLTKHSGTTHAQFQAIVEDSVNNYATLIDLPYASNDENDTMHVRSATAKNMTFLSPDQINLCRRHFGRHSEQAKAFSNPGEMIYYATQLPEAQGLSWVQQYHSPAAAQETKLLEAQLPDLRKAASALYRDLKDNNKLLISHSMTTGDVNDFTKYLNIGDATMSNGRKLSLLTKFADAAAKNLGREELTLPQMLELAIERYPSIKFEQGKGLLD